MVSVSTALPALAKQKSSLTKAAKGAGLGGLATGAFCLLDFTNVPGAFNLKYNSDGEKVEGTNWKSGLKELGKSAVRCVGYLAVPAAISGLACGAGVVVATALGIASLASSFVLSSVFEDFLPDEQKVVADACNKKGINLEQVA